MIEHIKALEHKSNSLEPSQNIRNEWMDSIFSYSEHFIDTIKERKSYDINTPPASNFDAFNITNQGKNVQDILGFLKINVDSPGINPASGGHIGYIPGGGIFPTALGDFLADITNRYAGIFFGNPGAVRLENQLIKWMCKLVNYPENAHGNLTSGGSIANLIALTTARDFHNIEDEKIRKAVIYLSEQTHHCVHKAIRICGLGNSIIRNCNLDEKFRIDADALEKQIEEDKQNGLIPFLVVGSAGSTDVGAMDPLDRIGDIAEKHKLWFHVDAAYGGFFILVHELKSIFKGIEKSDSLAIDPHKGLFLSYGLGAVLVKNVKALQQSHQYQANYMQDAFMHPEDLSPAELSPELTKHFRGMRMWLPLQLLGTEPFIAALEEKIYLCRYFYTEIQKHGFEVGPEPDLSVCIFRYVNTKEDLNTFNKRLVQKIHEDGRVFISSTSLNGEVWLRLAVLCFRTHLDTIHLLIEMINDCVLTLKSNPQQT
jgi:glutamate/tyrosine decarboxylase-like PLP-dependent enzyme